MKVLALLKKAVMLNEYQETKPTPEQGKTIQRVIPQGLTSQTATLTEGS